MFASRRRHSSCRQVAVSSTDIVVGVAENVVAVTAQAAPMVPQLIRRAPRAEVVVRSTGRPGAPIDAAFNGRAAVARGLTTTMAPLLRRREVNTGPVGIVCPEITLVRTAGFVW